MFKNYLLTLLRNFRRNKFNTAINVFGMAISIACCIAIYIFVKHEKTFDNFHAKKERIYRIVYDEQTDAGIEHSGELPFAAAKSMRTDFPQLEAVTQVYVQNKAVVSLEGKDGNKKIFEENEMMYADEYFLQTFDYVLLAGTNGKLLTQPDEIVLTRKLADRYFGSEFQMQYSNLIGSIVTVNKKPYHISAILEDAPRNSNFTFKMLLPFKVYEINNPGLVNSWKDVYSESFVFALLPANYRRASFETALQAFKNKHLEKKAPGISVTMRNR